MPPSYVEKITEVFVGEISSKEVLEGVMWAGFWDAWIRPSGGEFPFLVRFDRDTREISMGYCGECAITKENLDSLRKQFADSVARDSLRLDTAPLSKRGVVKPITK